MTDHKSHISLNDRWLSNIVNMTMETWSVIPFPILLIFVNLILPFRSQNHNFGTEYAIAYIFFVGFVCFSVRQCFVLNIMKNVFYNKLIRKELLFSLYGISET